MGREIHLRRDLSGTVFYVAFIFDAYSRMICGWLAAGRMDTSLVLDTLQHAIWTRQRDGIDDLAGLVHHTDDSRQGGSTGRCCIYRLNPPNTPRSRSLTG